MTVTLEEIELYLDEIKDAVEGIDIESIEIVDVREIVTYFLTM